MKLTQSEKQNLIKIYQKAQDILTTDIRVETREHFCCHAIDLAEGLRYGDGYRKNTLAYQYFCELFKPEDGYNSSWLSWPEVSFKKQQLRRLMTLQLCELSLT